jgi:hypothetical protein
MRVTGFSKISFDFAGPQVILSQMIELYIRLAFGNSNLLYDNGQGDKKYK